MEDFGKYLEESFDSLKVDFKSGEKVKGTVCAIDDKSVYLDVKSTSEGIIEREELLDENRELTVKIGDEVEAFFLDNKDGGLRFSIKLTGKHVSEQLEEAYASGIPVEGRVTGERKGGYTVKIANDDAFCPYSQMSLTRGNAEDFIGNSYLFNISELSGRNFVVSRRKILEQEKAAKLESFKENLKVGDILQGRVVNVKNFGVFVDLDGVQGFIPISELSWGRVNKPEEIVSVGDDVTVSVHDLDWERERITLSFRSANAPWEEIIEKYPVGTSCSAVITRLAHFGAFAELEPGLEGLIHISKLGAGRRINSPQEVVSVGETVEVVIENVDAETHRIGLARNVLGGDVEIEGEAKPAAEAKSGAKLEDKDLTPGAIIKGVVDAIKPFGAFVKLTPSKSGLLHISETGIPREVQNSFKALNDKFPVGSEIEVIIKNIDKGKFSLTLKEVQDRKKSASKGQGNFSDKGGNGFGSIGNLFDGL